MGVCGSAPRPNPTALSLPSSGVSSLDLGRLWQRRRPFFFVYAVTFAAILRRHRFSNPQHGRRACSCHIGKQRENHMAKTNYQGDLQRQGRRHPQARPHLQPNRSATRSSWRPMSQMGQKAKYSLRADVFRFTPESGRRATWSAVRFVPNSDIVPLYPECGVFLYSCQRRSFFRMHILSSLTTRTCKMNMESCYEHHSNSGFST